MRAATAGYGANVYFGLAELCVGRCEEDVRHQRELAPPAELPAGEEEKKGIEGDDVRQR